MLSDGWVMTSFQKSLMSTWTLAHNLEGLCKRECFTVVWLVTWLVTVITSHLKLQKSPDILVIALSWDIHPFKPCLYRGVGCTSAPLTYLQNVLTSIWGTSHHKYLAFKKWHKERKAVFSQFSICCSSSYSYSNCSFPWSHHCFYYYILRPVNNALWPPATLKHTIRLAVEPYTTTLLEDSSLCTFSHCLFVEGCKCVKNCKKNSIGSNEEQFAPCISFASSQISLTLQVLYLTVTLYIITWTLWKCFEAEQSMKLVTWETHVEKRHWS